MRPTAGRSDSRFTLRKHIYCKPRLLRQRRLISFSSGMEHEKSFSFGTFSSAHLSSAWLCLVFFILTYAFWNTWASWVAHLFKVDEKEFGRLVLLFFLQVRIVIVFLFLVPALALHWMAKK